MNIDKKIFEELKGRHFDVLSVERILQIDRELDHFFGINTLVEKDLKSEKEYFYTDKNLLEQAALNTSYFDFYQILKNLPANSKIVDVGAGYGRMALLNKLFNFGHRVISIEGVGERIEASQKYCDNKEDFTVQDIMDESFKLPEADAYYLYLPTGMVLEKILKDLLELALQKQFRVFAIESHGNLIDHLWLNQAWMYDEEIDLVTSLPRHKEKIYSFRTIHPVSVKEYHENLLEDQENLAYTGETLYMAMSYFKEKEYKVMALVNQIGKGKIELSFPLKESELYVDENGSLFLEIKTPRRLLRFVGDDEVIDRIIK